MFKLIMDDSKWMSKSSLDLILAEKYFLNSNVLKNHVNEIINWAKNGKNIILDKEDILHCLSRDTLITFTNNKQWLESDFNIFQKESLNQNEKMIDIVIKQYIFAQIILLNASWNYITASHKSKFKESMGFLKMLDNLELFDEEKINHNLLKEWNEKLFILPEYIKLIQENPDLGNFMKDIDKFYIILNLFVSYGKTKSSNNYGVLDFFADALNITSLKRLLSEVNEIHISDLADDELKEVTLIHKSLKASTDDIALSKIGLFTDFLEKEQMDIKRREFQHFVANYSMIANFELATRASREKINMTEIQLVQESLIKS